VTEISYLLFNHFIKLFQVDNKTTRQPGQLIINNTTNNKPQQLPRLDKHLDSSQHKV
jgi:hypothetical protein